MPLFDRAAIDKTRALNNLPPLTDEEFASLSGNGHSEEEKELQQKKVNEEIEAKKKEEEELKAKLEKEKVIPITKEIVEPTDDEVLAMIEKRTGRKIASWDELKPKAEEIDEEKAKEDREADKLSWAFKNKKFKQKDYENFITVSKDPKKLVYELRLQAALKDDPTLDEKVFQEEFDEEFGLDQKPETRRYKNGQETLTQIANSVLKSSFAPIYTLDQEYTQHEKLQNQKREREQKIKEGAPIFKQNLDKLKSELKKIPVTVSESESYEVEALDDSINRVIAMMSNPDWAENKILQGYTYEDLKNVARTTVIAENFPMLAKEVAKQYALKNAAGTKGILKIDGVGEKDDFELTEEQKVLKALNEKHKKPVPEGAN